MEFLAVLRRILSILSLPMAFVMLVTGLSPVTGSDQKAREAAIETAAAGTFEPVFRFAVASDVHVSAGDPTIAGRLKKLFDSVYRYADAHPTYNLLDAFVLTGDNSRTPGIR